MKVVPSIYHVDSPSGGTPLLVGLGLLLINTRLGWDLHGVHWYFLAVSAVCFALACRRYAVLDESGLVLFHGPPRFKGQICIRWDQIQKVEVRHTETLGRVKSLKLGDIPYRYPAPTLLIHLNCRVKTKVLRAVLGSSRRKLFEPVFEPMADGKGIRLPAAPREGFVRLVTDLSRHVDIQLDQPVDPMAGWLKTLPGILMSLILVPLVLALIRFLDVAF